MVAFRVTILYSIVFISSVLCFIIILTITIFITLKITLETYIYFACKMKISMHGNEHVQYTYSYEDDHYVIEKLCLGKKFLHDFLSMYEY